MKQGETPTHVMRFCPQDWASSPLRGELALEKDHLSRMVYLELLGKLHEAGGSLPRSEVAGALLITQEEAETALTRLIRSGRIQEDGGLISNPRVTADVQRRDGFRQAQAVSGRKGGVASAKARQGKPKASLQKSKRASSETKPAVALAVAVAVPLPLPLPKPKPKPETETALPAAPADEPPPTNATPEEATAKALAVIGPRAWNQLACEIVIRRYGGTAPGARVTKALRPIVAKAGEDAALAAFARYVDETEAEYFSPERFATTFGHWAGTVQARASPSPAQQRRREGMTALATAGLKGDGTLEGKGGS